MNEKDAYSKLWSGENAAEPYLRWLSGSDEGLQAYEPFLLSVVDVMHSGDAEQYEFISPSGRVAKNDFFVSDALQLWLRVTKQQLSTFKSEVETRIIIFNREVDITVRNLLGTKYNLRPEFFADIQHSEWLTNQQSVGRMIDSGSLRWPGAYQAFNYATGTATRHLKFENGFIACVLQDAVSNPDGWKNVGTYRAHSCIRSNLTQKSLSVQYPLSTSPHQLRNSAVRGFYQCLKCHGIHQWIRT